MSQFFRGVRKHKSVSATRYLLGIAASNAVIFLVDLGGGWLDFSRSPELASVTVLVGLVAVGALGAWMFRRWLPIPSEFRVDVWTQRVLMVGGPVVLVILGCLLLFAK